MFVLYEIDLTVTREIGGGGMMEGIKGGKDEGGGGQEKQKYVLYESQRMLKGILDQTDN